MINKINKERRRSMNATPIWPSNKNQWKGAQADPKQKQDRATWKSTQIDFPNSYFWNMKIIHVEKYIVTREKTDLTHENFGRTVCHVKFWPSWDPCCLLLFFNNILQDLILQLNLCIEPLMCTERSFCRKGCSNMINHRCLGVRSCPQHDTPE
jgi:hypothetical protein